MKATTVRIKGEEYDLHGKVASGEFCDVYYGSRVDPLQVVAVKLARENDPESVLALRQEVENISALAASEAQGHAYFTQFLPGIVVPSYPNNVSGPDGYVGTANVFRWRVGFQYTYEDIQKAYPQGVDGRTAIWMWKRMLDVLGFVHESGFVHGSVTPQHILVQPRDHGSVFCGWSRAVRIGEPLRFRSTEYEMYYPQENWEGEKATPDTDIIMPARSLFCVLGGDVSKGTLPDEVHPELANLIYCHASGNRGSNRFHHKAWELLMEVDRVAKIVYGGSKFHPFAMPPA